MFPCISVVDAAQSFEQKNCDIKNENTTSGSQESDTSQSVGISENGSSNNASTSLDKSSGADQKRESSCDRLPDKHRLMSRRTFRHNWGSGSICSKANGGRDNGTYKEKHLTSLGSESFYSMQSWIKPENENEGPTQNLSNSARLKNLKHNRSELMILVEELKDQLGGLYVLKDEKEPICQSDIMSLIQQANNSGPSSHPRKARPSKRFCRPVSGGSPFVVCYKCFEVLHMPADFIISARRLNKLKCGACSEILSLPFPARAHGVPHASAESGNSTEMGLDLPLHRLMGYPSARFLLH